MQTSRLEGDGGAGVKDLKEIEEMEVFEFLRLENSSELREMEEPWSF